MIAALRSRPSAVTSIVSLGTLGPQKDRLLNTGSGLGLSNVPITLTAPTTFPLATALAEPECAALACVGLKKTKSNAPKQIVRFLIAVIADSCGLQASLLTISLVSSSK
jgi:hypothetical protein